MDSAPRMASLGNRLLVVLGVAFVAGGVYEVSRAMSLNTPADASKEMVLAVLGFLAAAVCWGIAGREAIARANRPWPQSAPNAAGRVPCLMCREDIHPDAVICPHCQHKFTGHARMKNAQAQVNMLILGALVIVTLVVVAANFLL